MNKRLQKKMAKKAAQAVKINNGIPKGYAKLIAHKDHGAGGVWNGYEIGDILEVLKVDRGMYNDFADCRDERGVLQTVNLSHLQMGDA